MSRLFYHICQDNAGNLLFDVTGTMRLAGSGTLATIYGDENLTVILPNPMTNHPSFGSFKCFLGSGAYDFYMAKSGYTFETLTGVQGTGTMAQQNASAVAITGGTAAFTGTLSAATRIYAGSTVAVLPAKLHTTYDKGTEHGLTLSQKPNDNGTGYAVAMVNNAGTIIGTISTTAAAVAYNTTSDRRLKKNVTPLTGALDVVRALRPITHLWRADDSRGYGFVAHEVQDTLPADAGVVTGERDAVGPQGEIVPQQIDYGKLVPWLTAALQEALTQVEVLSARMAALEGARA